MSNPVLNRMSSEIRQTTPAGYPTMPGYQVGTSARPSYGQPNTYQNAPLSHSPFGQAPYAQSSMADFEQAYVAPSADAVDRGVMTYDDVIIRSGMLFGILFVGAAVSWMTAVVNPAVAGLLMLASTLIALVLAMVNIFSKTIRPLLIMAYAGFEGLALGAISAFMDFRYPGIVVQALIATIAVFGVTLALFSSGKVRNSPKLQRLVIISLVGIISYRVLAGLLTWVGVIGQHPDTITIAGLPLGAIVGVGAVIIGAISLIGDFDEIKQGVNAGAPARFAWMAAFGLMVTIVWMYTEILRLLSYFRD